MTRKDVLVLKDLLGTNKQAAGEIRRELRARGILCVNLLSAPGSGKTALLEALADRLKGRYRMAVIGGDIETERDAERIRRRGVPAWQITTGGACHLEAKMVGKVLREALFGRSVVLLIGTLAVGFLCGKRGLDATAGFFVSTRSGGPGWAARIAATYPPGPEPMIVSRVGISYRSSSSFRNFSYSSLLMRSFTSDGSLMAMTTTHPLP